MTQKAEVVRCQALYVSIAEKFADSSSRLGFDGMALDDGRKRLVGQSGHGGYTKHNDVIHPMVNHVGITPARH